MPTQRACQLIMMYSKKTFPSELALMLAISGGEYSRAYLTSPTICRMSDVESIAGHSGGGGLRRSRARSACYLQCSHSIISPSVCQISDVESMHWRPFWRQWVSVVNLQQTTLPRSMRCGSCIFPGKSLQPLSNLRIPRGCTWRPF